MLERRRFYAMWHRTQSVVSSLSFDFHAVNIFEFELRDSIFDSVTFQHVTLHHVPALDFDLISFYVL